MTFDASKFYSMVGETVKDGASMWSMLHLVLVIFKALVPLASAGTKYC